MGSQSQTQLSNFHGPSLSSPPHSIFIMIHYLCSPPAPSACLLLSGRDPNPGQIQLTASFFQVPDVAGKDRPWSPIWFPSLRTPTLPAAGGWESLSPLPTVSALHFPSHPPPSSITDNLPSYLHGQQKPLEPNTLCFCTQGPGPVLLLLRDQGQGPVLLSPRDRVPSSTPRDSSCPLHPGTGSRPPPHPGIGLILLRMPTLLPSCTR